MEQSEREYDQVCSTFEIVREAKEAASTPARKSLKNLVSLVENAKKEVEQIEKPLNDRLKQLALRKAVLSKRLHLRDNIVIFRERLDKYVKEGTFDNDSCVGEEWTKAQIVFAGNRCLNYYWNENSSGYFPNTGQAGDTHASKANDYVKGENEHVFDMYRAFEIAGDKTRTAESRRDDITTMITRFVVEN